MKASDLFCYAICALGAAYYITMTLLEYFRYETFTVTWIVETEPSNILVVCGPKNSEGLQESAVTGYEYVMSYLGNYTKCQSLTLQDEIANISTEAIRDIKIYVTKYADFEPWHLSRLNLLLESYLELIRGYPGIRLWMVSEKVMTQLLPAPYPTNCHNYDQYRCIYDCTQSSRRWNTCLRLCAKQGCKTTNILTLGDAPLGINSNISEVNFVENSHAVSTIFGAKTNVSFTIVNILGLVSAFFGTSVFSCTQDLRKTLKCRKWRARKITKTVVYICAMLHCFSISKEYLEYRHVTETYQGDTNVDLPSASYSICLSELSTNGHSWASVAESHVELSDIVGLILFRRGPHFVSIKRETLRIYAANHTFSYSLSGKFCFFLVLPNTSIQSERIARRIPGTFNVELLLALKKRYTVAISPHIGSHIYGRDPMEMITKSKSSFQNRYARQLFLPPPYQTRCQIYGIGHLKRFKSRDHCVMECALKRHRQLHPGQHPLDIPISNTSDNSIITGKAKVALDLCDKTTCRWPDCISEQFKLSKIDETVSWAPALRIAAPAQDIFLFKDVPLTMFTDIMLLLVSTIGFWTGFSMVTLTRPLKVMLTKLKTKTRCRILFRKLYRLLILLGLLWNLWAAVRMYMWYDSITQSHVDSTPMASSVNLVMISRGISSCFSRNGCTQRQIKDTISWYRNYSRKLIPRVSSRHPENLSWLTHSAESLHNMIETYQWLNYIVTELQLAENSIPPETTKLAASGSLAVHTLELQPFGQDINVLLVDTFDNFDPNSVIIGSAIIAIGQHGVFGFEVMDIVSLPAPYHTDCISYQLYGHHNQRHCTQHCMERRFSKIFNKTNSCRQTR
ncbi:hypothetical protein HDE_03613 [Halotydeus destructor]|nr:hypothetical protein HDE_03613 [Halotydeus destructor]